MTGTTVNAGIAHGALHRGRPGRRHQGARRPDRRQVDAPASSRPRWSTPPTAASSTSSSSAPGSPAAPAAATLGEAGYNVKVFCFQDSPAPRALHRRAGRHQRREELQGGRRLHLPPLLRHGQGRRLPRPGDQRLPAGRGQRQHHRPVRRAGRAVRPRVRRPARQPLVRWRAGVAHLLRPRPDRPAAAHRRLPGARAPGRRGHGRAVHPPRDARAHRRRRQGPRHHRPRPRHRRDRDPPRGCRRARLRRLRQRLLPLDQRDGVQRHRELAGAPQGRLHGQPLLHADPPDLHPGVGRAPEQADPDVGVAAQRRPDLGAEEPRRLRQGPAPDPRGRPRLLPRAHLPELRQPRAARHRVAPGEERLRRGSRGRPAGRRLPARRLPRLHRRHRPPGQGGRRGEVRQPLRHVRPDHRARTRTRCRCGSTPPCTTSWAGCGSTTTCSRRSPGCSSPARPTSPTTAPTGSARRR